MLKLHQIGILLFSQRQVGRGLKSMFGQDREQTLPRAASSVGYFECPLVSGQLEFVFKINSCKQFCTGGVGRQARQKRHVIQPVLVIGSFMLFHAAV